HVDQLVLREMDRVGYRIARFLEEHGHWAFQTAAQETVWEMKSASYGYLSTRHVAIEAGLGTIGLELNLLTKEAGPRCYTTVVLTDAVLEPDGKLPEQLCIGEPCSRCLYSCPPDAVQHWGLDKRRCATFAQEFGFSTILRVFSGLVGQEGAEAKLGTLAGHEWFGIWQGLLRVVGAFGDCPRCLAVGPVGDDDNRVLKDAQREIPEKTDHKVARARQLITGINRLRGHDDRHKQYSTELVLTDLEEIELKLVYFLEDAGFPSITIPPVHFDPRQYDPKGDTRGPLSLTHAAVEAGLGTLGLNLMLLTPEYGPRIMLGAVLTSADLEPDRPIAEALCLGEPCGRCLLACPADAIGQWTLDKERCAPLASPYGFTYLMGHVERLVKAPSDAQLALLKSKESFMSWQSILRGVGVYSGCTR